MSTDYSKAQPDCKTLDKAEYSNGRPADPARLGYLTSVAYYALGIGEAVPIRGDEALALYRICIGRGEPVELFKIQNDPGDGGGFMAMLTPRIHSLRHRYGFAIDNRIEREAGGNRSWYWIVLEDSGFPKMRPVELAPVKTGTPKAASKTATPNNSVQAVITLAGTQSGLFGTASTATVWRGDPEMEASR